MNDLPIPSGNPPIGGSIPTPIDQSHIGYSSSVHKEAEPGISVSEVSALKESGKDREEIPSEIASVGVKIHPTTIAVPSSLQQLGVQASGANIGMPAQVITLPLTDDQIARGLTQSISSSYHWLAQWCIRRLKQMHVGFKKIHGSMTRVNE